MISNPAFLYDENDNLSKLIGCIRNSNHSSFVELLNGMKLHFINNVIYDGHTIMQHAVIHGLDDFVNTLLSLNVDANIGEGLNKPVLLAASYGHWKILKTFMDLRWQEEKKCVIHFDVWTTPSEENVLHLGMMRLKYKIAQKKL